MPGMTLCPGHFGFMKSKVGGSRVFLAASKGGLAEEVDDGALLRTCYNPNLTDTMPSLPAFAARFFGPGTSLNEGVSPQPPDPRSSILEEEEGVGDEEVRDDGLPRCRPGVPLWL